MANDHTADVAAGVSIDNLTLRMVSVNGGLYWRGEIMDNRDIWTNGRKPVFAGPGTQHWEDHWFLDGLKATATNTPAGLVLRSGPVADGDASHAVLWTKQSFAGGRLGLRQMLGRESRYANFKVFLKECSPNAESRSGQRRDVILTGDLTGLGAMKVRWRNVG